MINVADYLSTIHDKIQSAFPEYYIEIESVPDSPNTLAAAVYGVMPDDIVRVRSFVNDLDWSLLGSTKYGLMPMIIDRDNTEECYPEFLRYNQDDAPLCLDVLVELDALVGLYAGMRIRTQEHGRGWPSDAPMTAAADADMTDLALAA